MTEPTDAQKLKDNITQALENGETELSRCLKGLTLIKIEKKETTIMIIRMPDQSYIVIKETPSLIGVTLPSHKQVAEILWIQLSSTTALYQTVKPVYP